MLAIITFLVDYIFPFQVLFRFTMNGMLLAKTTILRKLDSVRRILLVLHSIVITLFAFRAS